MYDTNIKYFQGNVKRHLNALHSWGGGGGVGAQCLIYDRLACSHTFFMRIKCFLDNGWHLERRPLIL